MPFSTLANSTFLDSGANNLATAEQYAAVANGSVAPLLDLFRFPGSTVTVGAPASGTTITVGLVLDHASDPTSLLAGNWAQREAALATFPNSAALWSAYGAISSDFNQVVGAVAGVVGSQPLQTATQIGYASAPADRTIWLNLTPAQFQSLFGQALQQVTTNFAGGGSSSTLVWTGNLGLDSSIPASVVKGLWVEQNVNIPNPAVLDSKLVSVPLGPLGVGNGAAGAATPGHVIATPAAIAANYKFPLPADVATAPIALVETDIGGQSTLFADYNLYRQQVGLAPVSPAQFQVLSGTNNAGGNLIQEVTLDISVVAGAVPNSAQYIYSELSNHGGTPFNAYQQAFFDYVHHPAVLSSSYPEAGQPTPNSPFQFAWQQLFVDGALANVSTHMAGGDQGSSANIPNGAANVINAHSSPFTLIVGGTSIAGLYTASADSTLTKLENAAIQDDPATVFSLVAAGLRSLPSKLSPDAPSPAGQATTLHTLFEAVWQELTMEPVLVNGQREYGSLFGANQTGSGGLAITAIPSYQAAFGLSSLTDGHRGTPDVAALATGDTSYTSLNADYVNGSATTLTHGDGGTSSAAPLWASLTTQFNTIFHDQGLPNLGYYNDLLYIADVIAPASFNDVQLGNNINSFFTPNTTTVYYNTNLGVNMTPTGQGFSATPGYDLASGLGTPDGVLLARALTAIAHEQVSFSNVPNTINANGVGGWTSGANQTLSFQFQTTTPVDGAQIGLNIGGGTSGLTSGAPGAYAWTSQLAEQSLQPDFDSGLVKLFDGYSQGAAAQSTVSAGQSLALTINSQATQATQATLSSPFGFADFFSGSEAVRAARVVTVAETVGAQNDQLAVVRLRHVDTDSLALTLYKVDNLSGSIGNLQPGDPGYQAAVQGRAYQTTTGATSIDAGLYGEYSQALVKHVNAGDMIAMQLTDKTTGLVYSAFTQANETVNGQNVTHLWNYGSNTWGWESSLGGGDRDFNDLVVQIDLTSAYGHGWLI